MPFGCKMLTYCYGVGMKQSLSLITLTIVSIPHYND